MSHFKTFTKFVPCFLKDCTINLPVVEGIVMYIPSKFIFLLSCVLHFLLLVSMHVSLLMCGTQFSVFWT